MRLHARRGRRNGEERGPQMQRPTFSALMISLTAMVLMAALGGMLLFGIARFAWPEFAPLFSTFGAVGAGGAAFMFALIIGGAASLAGSSDRFRYVKLRTGLIENSGILALYNRWLSVLLVEVDKFFGDIDQSDTNRSWKIFKLKNSAPLWTAASFDRCILLALMYPTFTILLFWMLSGHVGLAEEVLGLKEEQSLIKRFMNFASLCGLIIVFKRVSGWAIFQSLSRKIFLIVFYSSIALLLAHSGILPLALIATIAYSGCAAVVGALAGAVGLIIAPSLSSWDELSTVNAVVCAAFFVISFDFFYLRNATRGYRTRLLYLLMPLITVVLIGTIRVAAIMPSWPVVAPLLLFFCLLTLVNAPFDWLSLGLTRYPPAQGPRKAIALAACLRAHRCVLRRHSRLRPRRGLRRRRAGVRLHRAREWR